MDSAHARRQSAFPALFVALWSTGFIVAKYGLPYAPPFTFVLYRVALVTALMLAVSLAMRATWPREGRQITHIVVVGLLVHGSYLGGVYVSIAGGMPAGVSAMLVGMQPLLTTVLALVWLGERVVARQWVGLAFGLAGVFCVVHRKASFSGELLTLVPCAIALVGISIGTLYQKRYCSNVDLRSGSVIQFGACTILYLPLALLFEGQPVHWTPPFLFALGWSVLVLSVGAISVLYWLLRHGAAVGVARLFYMVPPITALMAWLIFGETLDALAIIGMLLIAVGVALGRPPSAN